MPLVRVLQELIFGDSPFARHPGSSLRSRPRPQISLARSRSHSRRYYAQNRTEIILGTQVRSVGFVREVLLGNVLASSFWSVDLRYSKTFIRLTKFFSCLYRLFSVSKPFLCFCLLNFLKIFFLNIYSSKRRARSFIFDQSTFSLPVAQSHPERSLSDVPRHVFVGHERERSDGDRRRGCDSRNARSNARIHVHRKRGRAGR